MKRALVLLAVVASVALILANYSFREVDASANTPNAACGIPWLECVGWKE